MDPLPVANGAQRQASLAALAQLLQLLQTTPFQLMEPFWPASSRFDDIAAKARPADWFAAAATEHYERISSFSSFFVGSSSVLTWLCSQPYASAEMERRRTLIAARAGLWPQVPKRLCTAAPDHLNAEIWRAGKVPGTVVAA